MVDTGTTAWVLLSATLVLLMTPGLAMFYGGMNRHRGVLNMMMMSFGSLGLISVLWVLYGYSVAFGTSQGGVIGSFTEYFGLAGLMPSGDQIADGEVTSVAVGAIPDMAFVAFQGCFAILTVALISGAIADRAKFGPWMVFAGAWATVVYFPVAHWVFAFQDGEGGWIADGLESIDLAGGTAVHINAGAAALALAIVLGRRKGFGKEPMRPNNLPLVMLGAGLLWFGWFGFNGASFLTSDGIAAYVWVNTLVATGAAVLGWLLVERLRDGHSTSLGAASGVVAGLVAITPACGAVTPVGAIFIGLIAGVVCAFAVGLKYKLNYDDSLDVVGVHLVGGLLGTILIVLFGAGDAAPAYAGYPAGLFYGGGLDLLYRQTVPAFAVMAYSFVMALIIGLVIQKTIGFRASEDAEAEGIDATEHAESAYVFSGIGAGGFSPKASVPAPSSKSEVSA